MSSALEHEDLENVALVRMEDVQPSRDRIDRRVDIHIPAAGEEIFEYCIDDKVEYENECEIDDDSDSNIGSMVSIQSEEMIEEEEEDSDPGELIVPEVTEVPIEINVPMKANELKTEVKPNQSDSWPTLEILPGGVIKNSVECETFPKSDSKPPGKGEMMYACAKCSQVFKYLFCLVKHVKWHEDQNKLMKTPHLKKMRNSKVIFFEIIRPYCGNCGVKILTNDHKLKNTKAPLEEEFVLVKKERNELDQKYKMQKIEVLARIAAAIGKINNAKEIFNK